ncbi:MAG: TIGR03086 family metal-binding protein [Ilumatobacteraceae bacterium]
MSDLDLAQMHRQALAATRTVIAGIKSDQWHASTPCAEWDVSELANHLIAGNWWAAELANGATIASVGDRLDGDVLGTDPLRAYDDSAAVAANVFERSGAMSAPCAVSYGPVPGAMYCGHRFIDVFIHGWDLAKATGQSTELDPILVAACLEVVKPQAEMFAGSGMFGDGGTSALGEKNPQHELLTMLGRNP